MCCVNSSSNSAGDMLGVNECIEDPDEFRTFPANGAGAVGMCRTRSSFRFVRWEIRVCCMTRVYEGKWYIPLLWGSKRGIEGGEL